jgi:hydrogenase maturation protein HypF
MKAARLRARYRFRGVIQGVGFRPTVYRCAASLGLSGFVRNQRSEVVAEVEGPQERVEAFPEALRRLLPPAARLDSVIAEPLEVSGEEGFRIEESVLDAYRFPPIPPDLAMCAQCAEELLDPRDRRYLYPFITCTQCGPRYSILKRTPFDRETTSMADFRQCAECLREYGDPGDRRFHSQTNSCPACGPRLVLSDASGRPLPGDPLVQAVAALAEGRVVALQGIGGFHLAADPRCTAAVERLRRDKERERKPFALMAADLEEARGLCLLEEGDEEVLSSPASPILIRPARPGAPGHLDTVSNTGTLGVMLPYTPVHLLLFRHPQAPAGYRHLIMTSGNRKGEPILIDPAEARARLGDAADLFLTHDRRIVFRTDDSVLRLGETGAAGASRTPVLLRRSRGYVPGLVTLRAPVARVTLGLGGDLKNAPALARGADVYLAPFIGDLEDPRTLLDFERQVERILELYAVRPEAVVFDLHPLYHSSRLAERFPEARRLGVQHHHAHALAAMAEHGLERTLALAFDGTGYGTDGTIWGGEFLEADRRGFRRLGCFRPFPLPGGEAAVLHPPRAALALLAGRLPAAELERLLCRDGRLSAGDARFLLDMIGRGLNSPLTSSLGRVFDAAAALLGLVDRVAYEGEGPIRMEGLALAESDSRVALQDLLSGGPVGAALEDLVPLGRPAAQGGLFQMDASPLLVELAERAARPGFQPGPAALLFHRAIALASLQGAREMRRRTGRRELVLSGGVFQNTLLLDLLAPALRADGFEVYTHQAIPPGDGGLAVGQVYFQGEVV